MDEVDYQISLMTMSGASDYRALWLHALQESPLSFSDHYDDAVGLPVDWFRDHYLAGPAQPLERFTLGCRIDERLVGIVSLIRDQRINARHKAILQNMYVHESVRGRGIGATLINTLIRHATAMPGLSQIYLWALDRTLCKFYTSFGFDGQGPAVALDLCINGRWVSAYYMTRNESA